MKRCLLYQDGSSHKFWNLEQIAEQLLVHYGKAGAAGQRQTKQLASVEAATHEADKLVREKLRKGYQETAAPGTPQQPAGAAASLLLVEKVAGKRIKLVPDFRHFQLGSAAEVKRQLEASGAVVVSAAAQNFDFYLASTDLVEGDPAEIYHRPVVFEEEILAAPLAIPTAGPLAGLRARVLELCRTLLAHPGIRVTRLTLGPPLSEAGLAENEARLGQRLPACLRAFYQQLGELCLLWQYRFPQKGCDLRDAGEAAPVHAWNIDEDDNHDGSIQLMPLASMLFGDWHNPGLGFDLTASQRQLDFYSEYNMVAVDLATGDDPLVYLGNDYGASFHDEPPMRFSDYLALVLSTFGLSTRLHFWQQTLNGRFEAGAAVALEGLARLPEANPFGVELRGSTEPLEDAAELTELLDEYSDAGREEHFFWLLEHALQHNGLVLGDYEELATNPRYHRRPRYRALRPTRPAAPRPDKGVELLLSHGFKLGLNADPLVLQGYFTLKNHSRQPNELLGYHVRLVARFYDWKKHENRELLLHEYDSEQLGEFLPAEDGSSHQRYLSARHGWQTTRLRGDWQLPQPIAPRKVLPMDFFLHDMEVVAPLLPYRMVVENPESSGRPRYELRVHDCYLKILLTVRLARENPGGPLHAEEFIFVTAAS